ncbi:hypothetical protein TVAG_360080 [Trichomonas vaginalis G3]|uniref:HECT domain-containing protein n=1 Tax=Trichomonas vaginalis (strain ATCC PRA-98 / G3) TaxID=412133 RepID=A2DTC7_TRIV3|nr:ubiquitin protein ligase protein [Trichomonas vaginalis G3]EAY16399.1 hypothetical protein TVAG_360080 [Trichomonas vaginalis G3]KAI5488373.1 ubiquitin protein ligase protein [Trichomonas vaginalis G3]|eukprot:XP_001328622.1 hypothetical protein [Trichomonas vaginalis G3]
MQNSHHLVSIFSDLKKLYEILDEAVRFEDITTLKYAINNKMTNLIEPKRNNLNFIIYAAKENNLNFFIGFNKLGLYKDLGQSERILLAFCENGNLDGVKFASQFVDFKSSENASTQLLIAANNFDFRICEFLCSQPGIRKNIKDNTNKTPYDIVKNSSKYNDLLDMLEIRKDFKMLNLQSFLALFSHQSRSLKVWPVFVEAILGFTDDELLKLLKFITGSKTFKPDLLLKLEIKSISDHDENEYSNPISHTYSNTLELNPFKSPEILGEKLKVIIDM